MTQGPSNRGTGAGLCFCPLRATREAKVHGEEKPSPNERSIDASRAAVLPLMATEVRGPPLGFRADNTTGTYVTALPPPPYLYEPIYLCFIPCPSPHLLHTMATSSFLVMGGSFALASFTVGVLVAREETGGEGEAVCHCSLLQPLSPSHQCHTIAWIPSLPFATAPCSKRRHTRGKSLFLLLPQRFKHGGKADLRVITTTRVKS